MKTLQIVCVRSTLWPLPFDIPTAGIKLRCLALSNTDCIPFRLILATWSDQGCFCAGPGLAAPELRILVYMPALL